MVDLGNPIRNPMGSKMAPKSASGATNLKFLALCELARSLFGVPNSGSTSGSIFNRFVVDVCSFVAVWGAYANRFWMILIYKFNSFGTACVSHFPSPQRGPSATHLSDPYQGQRHRPSGLFNIPDGMWRFGPVKASVIACDWPLVNSQVQLA